MLYCLLAYLLNHMKLSVITVTWNNEAHIAKQIESVQNGAKIFEIEQIIVDNNSADKTVEIIKKYPKVRLFAGTENLGFAAANNIALRSATGDMILFLNPDMEVLPNSLDELLIWFGSKNDVGLAGCKLITPDGSFSHHAKPRRFPKFYEILALFLKIPHFYPAILNRYLMKGFDPDLEQEVDSVRGSFMLLKKSVLDEIGFAFDPRYFIWFEDIDLCREVKKRHLKVMYTPIISCMDYVGQSFKRHKVFWKQWNFFRSALKYFLKWGFFS